MTDTTHTGRDWVSVTYWGIVLVAVTVASLLLDGPARWAMFIGGVAAAVAVATAMVRRREREARERDTHR